MMSADQVERRLNFALNSPDFWRGLIIALAVLTIAMVVKVLFATFRNPRVEPSTHTRWTQAAGLVSYGLLVFTSAGTAFERLGEVDFSWRLVTSAIGIICGLAWAYGATGMRNPFRKRGTKKDD